MPLNYLCPSDAFRGWRLLLAAAAAALLPACATLERLPAVTYAQAGQTNIYDIPDARFYVTDTERIYNVAIKAYQRSNLSRAATRARH
jgi:hypothetical protein